MMSISFDKKYSRESKEYNSRENLEMKLWLRNKQHICVEVYLNKCFLNGFYEEEPTPSLLSTNNYHFNKLYYKAINKLLWKEKTKWYIQLAIYSLPLTLVVEILSYITIQTFLRAISTK